MIAEQLIDLGINVNATNNDKETALFYAARRGQAAIVRLLLQRGADPDILDNDGDKAIDHTRDNRTKASFDFCDQSSIPNNLSDLQVTKNGMPPTFNHNLLLNVYLFLNIKEIGRCSCVAGKWHRVSETEVLWSKLGVRRWEKALQSSLGFGQTATSSFMSSRPSSSKRSTKLSSKAV